MRRRAKATKMTSDGNWIKLNRDMLDNYVVCKDADHFAIWVWLLLNACYKEREVMFDDTMITLKPGQLITTKVQIEKALHVEKTKAHRVLTELQNALQIEQRAGTKCRLITIKNWDKYQSIVPQSEPQNEPIVHHNCTTTAPLKKKERNSLLKIEIKKKLNRVGAYTGVHDALVDEVVDTLCDVDSDERLKYGGVMYVGEEFREMAALLELEDVCRIVNRLLSHKDEIKNRKYYILATVAGVMRGEET